VGVLESPGRGRIVVLALIGLGLVLAAFAAWSGIHEDSVAARPRDRPIPGEGERVVVEVLNATRVLGLARAATHRLRDAGIDVVAVGSDTGAVLDSTQVLVRRGPAGPGERVANALGAGRPRVVPDPSRLVDVTVRLGRDFLARGAAPAGDP
jgi:hypothetical protein